MIKQTKGQWSGEDIGLGIIDRLNGETHPESTRKVFIRVIKPDWLEGVDHPPSLFPEEPHQIMAVYLTTAKTKENRMPYYTIPEAETMNEMISVVRSLVADPPFIPSQSKLPSQWWS